MKTCVSGMAACAAAVFSVAGQASAYTPKWLQCDGQVIVKGTANDDGTRPAHDTFIYDDDNKHLFAWLRNSQAMEPVKLYNDNEIRWEGTNADTGHWVGSIDRKSLGMRLDYAETGSTRTWTEQCKPTSPLDSSVSADAGSAPAGAAKGGPSK